MERPGRVRRNPVTDFRQFQQIRLPAGILLFFRHLPCQSGIPLSVFGSRFHDRDYTFQKRSFLDVPGVSHVQPGDSIFSFLLDTQEALFHHLMHVMYIVAVVAVPADPAQLLPVRRQVIHQLIYVITTQAVCSRTVHILAIDTNLLGWIKGAWDNIRAAGPGTGLAYNQLIRINGNRHLS